MIQLAQSIPTKKVTVRAVYHHVPYSHGKKRVSQNRAVRRAAVHRRTIYYHSHSLLVTELDTIFQFDLGLSIAARRSPLFAYRKRLQIFVIYGWLMMDRVCQHNTRLDALRERTTGAT